MSSRDIILGRIRGAMADGTAVELPATPEVWPRKNPDSTTMVRRFAEELGAVAGELHRCGSMEEARRTLLQLMDEAEWKTIAAVDRPPARELLDGVDPAVDPARVSWAADDWTPEKMADLPVGLVSADYLLADTGTCMIACATPPERLMCYLPPTSVVIARTDQLVEHLPAAWDEVARRSAEAELRGEFVFITGPSRTADIEKILILGVHGPKRLVVLLVG